MALHGIRATDIGIKTEGNRFVYTTATGKEFTQNIKREFNTKTDQIVTTEVDSGMADTNLFALPGKEKEMTALGKKMKSAEAPPNEEGGEQEGSSKGERPIVGKQGIYNHPTSKELATKKE